MKMRLRTCIVAVCAVVQFLNFSVGGFTVLDNSDDFAMVTVGQKIMLLRQESAPGNLMGVLCANDGTCETPQLILPASRAAVASKPIALAVNDNLVVFAFELSVAGSAKKGVAVACSLGGASSFSCSEEETFASEPLLGLDGGVIAKIQQQTFVALAYTPLSAPDFTTLIFCSVELETVLDGWVIPTLRCSTGPVEAALPNSPSVSRIAVSAMPESNLALAFVDITTGVPQAACCHAVTDKYVDVDPFLECFVPVPMFETDDAEFGLGAGDVLVTGLHSRSLPDAFGSGQHAAIFVVGSADAIFVQPCAIVPANAEESSPMCSASPSKFDIKSSDLAVSVVNGRIYLSFRDLDDELYKFIECAPRPVSKDLVCSSMIVITDVQANGYQPSSVLLTSIDKKHFLLSGSFLGTFDTPAPTCPTAVIVETINGVTHTVTFPDGFSSSKIWQRPCKTGYSGAIRRLCGSSGQWIDAGLSRCVRKQCPAEGVEVHAGTVIQFPATNENAGVISKQCPAPFESSVQRTCAADSDVWSDTSYSCSHPLGAPAPTQITVLPLSSPSEMVIKWIPGVKAAGSITDCQFLRWVVQMQRVQSNGRAEWADVSSGSCRSVLEPSTTSCVVAGLDDGTSYMFRVRLDCRQAHLASAWSPEARGVTQWVAPLRAVSTVPAAAAVVQVRPTAFYVMYNHNIELGTDKTATFSVCLADAACATAAPASNRCLTKTNIVTGEATADAANFDPGIKIVDTLLSIDIPVTDAFILLSDCQYDVVIQDGFLSAVGSSYKGSVATRFRFEYIALLPKLNALTLVSSTTSTLVLRVVWNTAVSFKCMASGQRVSSESATLTYRDTPLNVDFDGLEPGASYEVVCMGRPVDNEGISMTAQPSYRFTTPADRRSTLQSISIDLQQNCGELPALPLKTDLTPEFSPYIDRYEIKILTSAETTIQCASNSEWTTYNIQAQLVATSQYATVKLVKDEASEGNSSRNSQYSMTTRNETEGPGTLGETFLLEVNTGVTSAAVSRLFWVWPMDSEAPPRPYEVVFTVISFHLNIDNVMIGSQVQVPEMATIESRRNVSLGLNITSGHDATTGHGGNGTVGHYNIKEGDSLVVSVSGDITVPFWSRSKVMIGPFEFDAVKSISTGNNNTVSLSVENIQGVGLELPVSVLIDDVFFDSPFSLSFVPMPTVREVQPTIASTLRSTIISFYGNNLGSYPVDESHPNRLRFVLLPSNQPNTSDNNMCGDTIRQPGGVLACELKPALYKSLSLYFEVPFRRGFKRFAVPNMDVIYQPPIIDSIKPTVFPLSITNAEDSRDVIILGQRFPFFREPEAQLWGSASPLDSDSQKSALCDELLWVSRDQLRCTRKKHLHGANLNILNPYIFLTIGGLESEKEPNLISIPEPKISNIITSQPWEVGGVDIQIQGSHLPLSENIPHGAPLTIEIGSGYCNVVDSSSDGNATTLLCHVPGSITYFSLDDGVNAKKEVPVNMYWPRRNDSIIFSGPDDRAWRAESTLSVRPLPCAEGGKYRASPMTAECALCPPGQYSPTFEFNETGLVTTEEGKEEKYDLWRCLYCENELYQEFNGSESCQRCPDNMEQRIPVPHISVKDCVCKENFFFLDLFTGDRSSCQECPVGGVCAGGLSRPSCAQGYWADLSNSSDEDAVYFPDAATLLLRKKKLMERYTFEKCATEKACIAPPNKPPCTCADGHTGLRCGECMSRWYRQHDECHSCSAFDSLMTVIVGVVLVCLLLFFMLPVAWFAIGRELYGVVFIPPLYLKVYVHLRSWILNNNYRMFVTQSSVKSSISIDLPDLSANYVTHSDDDDPFLRGFSFTAFSDYRFGTLCFEDVSDTPFFAYKDYHQNTSEITIWTSASHNRKYNRGRSYFLGASGSDEKPEDVEDVGFKLIRARDVAGFYDYRKEFESGLRDLNGWTFVVSFYAEINGDEILKANDRVSIHRAGVEQSGRVIQSQGKREVKIIRDDGVQETVARWFVSRQKKSRNITRFVHWCCDFPACHRMFDSSLYSRVKRKWVYVCDQIALIHPRAMVRSYLTFGQLLYVMNQLNQDWPTGTSYILDLFSLTSFDLDLIHPECAIELSYFVKWLVLILAPSFMVLIFYAESLMFKCVFTRRRELSHSGVTETAAWSRAMAAFFACVAIFQLKIALSPWDCSPCGIGDERCMMDHPPFHCGASFWNWTAASPEWALMAIISLSFQFVIAGCMIFFVLIMWVSWQWHRDPITFKSKFKIFKSKPGEVPWFVSFSDFFADGYRGHRYTLRGGRDNKSGNSPGQEPSLMHRGRTNKTPQAANAGGMAIRMLSPAVVRATPGPTKFQRTGTFLTFGWACWTLIHTAFVMVLCQFYTREPTYGAALAAFSFFVFSTAYNHFKPCRMWVHNLIDMLTHACVFTLAFTATLSRYYQNKAEENGLTVKSDMDVEMGLFQVVVLWSTVAIMFIFFLIKIFAKPPQRGFERDDMPHLPQHRYVPQAPRPPTAMPMYPLHSHNNNNNNARLHERLPSEASIALSHDVAFRLAMPDDISESSRGYGKHFQSGISDESLRYLGMPRTQMSSAVDSVLSELSDIQRRDMMIVESSYESGPDTVEYESTPVDHFAIPTAGTAGGADSDGIGFIPSRRKPPGLMTKRTNNEDSWPTSSNQRMMITATTTPNDHTIFRSNSGSDGAARRSTPRMSPPSAGATPLARVAEQRIAILSPRSRGTPPSNPRSPIQQHMVPQGSRHSPSQRPATVSEADIVLGIPVSPVQSQGSPRPPSGSPRPPSASDGGQFSDHSVVGRPVTDDPNEV